MNNKNSLRKTIFKDELNYVFDKNQISESDKQKIISTLFENPLTECKQYLLKEDINNEETLNEKLNDIIKNNKEIIGAIKTLFLVHDDLKLPPELETLFLQNEKIAVFVGAGVSKLIKFPLWRELADYAIKYLYEKNYINYFEYQKITNEVIQPKQKITIFHKFIDKKSNEAKKFYEKYLRKPSKPTKNPEENLYEILVQFDWVKISSNIDVEFYVSLENSTQKQDTSVESESGTEENTPKDSLINKQIVYPHIEQINIQNIDYNNIYHIHGSIDKLEETILTTKDYLDAYYNNSKGLKTFLSDLFNEYNTIFIGYGLEEFELLEHLITKNKKNYVLLGSYLNELNLSRVKRKYFESINVEPIFYYLDFNGYYRLNKVLNSWLQQIKEARDKDYYQNIKEMDEVL